MIVKFLSDFFYNLRIRIDLKVKCFFVFFLCFLIIFKERLLLASCGSLFNPTSNQSEDPTNSLIRYFEELLALDALSEKNIAILLDDLKQGKIMNPITEYEANTSATSYIQYNSIKEKISDPDIDRNKVISWCEDILRNLKTNSETRTLFAQQTLESYIKMEFHPIELHSKFLGVSVPKFFKPRPIIEVMSTPVTQMQWFALMGDNPSNFKNGEATVHVLNKENKVVKIQPDHPVENLSMWSMLTFANKLSKLHNKKPVYDLEKLTLEHCAPTRYSDDYIRAAGFIPVNHCLPDSKAIYQEEAGFRIPLLHEYEFLRNHMDIFRFGRVEDKEKFSRQAWYLDNSKDMTHPVNELAPATIQGYEFHDLLGNVTELSQGSILDLEEPSFYLKNSSEFLFNSGGSYRSSMFSILHDSSLDIMLTIEEHQGSSNGFRLVRTLRP